MHSLFWFSWIIMAFIFWIVIGSSCYVAAYSFYLRDETNMEKQIIRRIGYGPLVWVVVIICFVWKKIKGSV